MRPTVARVVAAVVVAVVSVTTAGTLASASAVASPAVEPSALTPRTASAVGEPASLPLGAPLRDEPDDGAVVTLSDDVAHLVIRTAQGSSQLIARPLTRSGSRTALGAPLPVAELTGPRAFAEHDGDVAYLRAGDGRLVLRSGGVDTVPPWATDVLVDESTRVALTSRWVAVGPWLFDRATGARFGLRPPRGSSVRDVHLTDTRALLTVTQFFVPEHRGVYTVELGPEGPVGPLVRIARPEADDDLLDAVGVTSEHVVWTAVEGTRDEADHRVVMRWARVDALDAPPTERVLAPRGSLTDVRVHAVDGTRVLVSVDDVDSDRVELHDVDLLGSPTPAPVVLPPHSTPVAARASLVSFRDRAGQLWLTDHRGGTVTAPRGAAPTVTDASPRLLLTSGQMLTVTGTGLTGVTGVWVGGVPVTWFTAVSPTRLEAWVGPGAHGQDATVTVTTVGGTSAGPAGMRYADGFTVQSPQRLVDQVLTADRVTCFVVAGTPAVPAGAAGVALNVTAAAPSGPGHVVVYPDTAGTAATPPPTASTVNYEPGADVANAAFVQLPANGRVCAVSRGAARARVVLDVTGFVLPDAGIELQSPRRVLDTRPGAGHVGPVTGPLTPRTIHHVAVAGVAGVPVHAESVLVNVTVTGATTAGNLRVFGGDEVQVPGTSLVNFAPGTDKANSTLVPLGQGGTVALWSDSPVGVDKSPVHVVIDVVGYTLPLQATGRRVLTPSPPTRLVDTRWGQRSGPLEGPLAARTVHSVDVLRIVGRPEGVTAVVLNVTAIDPSALGNLRVYPDTDGTGRTPPPHTSTLNYVIGRAVPNQVVVPLPANGRVNFYSDTAPGSTVELAVDLAGFVHGS